MPQNDIERLFDKLEELRLTVSQYQSNMAAHVAAQLAENKARDEIIQKHERELFDRGGLRDQIVGWKAILGAVGVVCSIVAALCCGVFKK